MDTQIIIALCEGPHDVAFLNKTLKTVGFKSNEKTSLEEYPFPMNSLLIQEATKSDVEALNIQTVRQSLLPSNALKRGDIYIFLYIIGGDSKSDLRKQFIEKLVSFIRKPGEIRKGRIDDNVSLGVVYFFDADDKGVVVRIAEVKKEINEVIDEIPDESFTENSSIVLKEGLKIGSYIFSGNDNNTGKLEDILLPIMIENNEDIFNSANEFLEKHYDEDRLFPMKIEWTENEVITEKRSTKAGDKFKYNKSKSLIGTVGQLQHSGGANTVCIGFTDYLRLEKIQANPKCQEIISFVEKFIAFE